jgi:hypothetical protein
MEGEVQTGELYTEGEFNRIIEISEREKKRVEIFMGQIKQEEKTPVFCATQDHSFRGSYEHSPERARPPTAYERRQREKSAAARGAAATNQIADGSGTAKN